MRVFGIVVLAALLLMPALPGAEEKDRFVFTKDPQLQQIRPKKPVRIKLRRSAKEEYTWELTGDDVDEILKVDRRLRKQLNAP